ncbi:scavenger receptor cysteine-rich domain-containing group B protein-like [Anguilla rostrata]|uniref:scavenger receptor cysteine-rich domain-containing group B protein-like n=1 Tax=Anguilla rostrata TaxID=7938 RepID=UPI0030CA8BC1
MEIKFLLYADDLVLLSPTEQGLQRHLDLLEQYCQNWALTCGWWLGVGLFWLSLCSVVGGWVWVYSGCASVVRLVGGWTRCEGRVEVQHGGVWGTVCDDDWDLLDASVVCHQLDCGAVLAPASSSAFGKGDGAILLDNVDCKGGEPTLDQCGSLGWGVHNCYHHEDVGITCKDNSLLSAQGHENSTTPSPGISELAQGSVRLVGGLTPCQGRVEVHSQGKWGTVCDDDWGLPDADVVCRQAGCGRGVTATASAYFGSGTGPILLDNVNCHGDEERLAACYSLGWGVHNCGHHEDAGVICTGSSAPGPGRDHNLKNTQGKRLGRGLEAVVERRMRDKMKIILDNPSCPLYEELWQMGSTFSHRLTPPRCQTERFRHSFVPTAIRLSNSGAIRVVNGSSGCQGRVELFHAEQWGTVCDDGWDLPDAQVACRQLGCGPAAGAKVLGYFGYGSGPILLDNMDCRGNEEQLMDCFHLGWGQHNCGHHEDAGIICLSLESLAGASHEFGSTARAVTTELPAEGQVRLVNGTHWCEGRVEVFLEGQWGTVCDDAWDLPDAQVVCRQVGCGKAKDAKDEAFFGRGGGTILLDNLKCRGEEASLLECSHVRWDVHNCDHSEDAGVTCMLW